METSLFVSTASSQCGCPKMPCQESNQELSPVAIKSPSFKIWNAGRSVRKSVQANSVEELCEKGRRKLELKGALRIVLEADGTEIDDDSVLLDAEGPCAGKDIVLILLQVGEKWNQEFLQKQSPDDSVSDSLYLLRAISRHSKELRALIDPEFGLLEELLRLGLLNEESYEETRTRSNRFQKNEYLLHYIKLKSMEKELHSFLAALRNVEQGHVANFILANGERLDMRYGSERPLGVEEMGRLKANGPYLLSKLVITEELLSLLCASRAITDKHKEHINGQRSPTYKTVELINIMRMRSFAAFRAFIDALHETKQSHVAEVLSTPGVIIPAHVSVMAHASGRDVKSIEFDLAAKLDNFHRTLMDGSGDSEKYSSLWAAVKELWLKLELSGIRYKGSCQGNSITVFLWCRDRQSMSRLQQMQDSGHLEKMLQQTLALLADEKELLSFSLKRDEKEWKLVVRYFQALGSQIDDNKTSLFPMLPKELLEIVLIKSLLSFYNATWRAFPFTDFDPYRTLISVCRQWWRLIAERCWFRSTVKAYLAKHKIVQRNSVLDILPKELMELILMRSLCSFVCHPWKTSIPPAEYRAFRLMASVCQEWQILLTSRTWFSSTMKNYLKKNKHLAVLQEHYSLFDRCLEVDCLFLWEMRRSNLLSEEQVLEISSEPNHLKQTEYLFLKVFFCFSAENYMEFLKVLQRTSQGHIANYLEANGVAALADHDEWPLNDDATERLDCAQSHLGNFVPPEEFLDALKTINCITAIHAEGISVLPDGQKLSELIRILKKRSFVAYQQFAAHLRKLDQYADVAQILTAYNGSSSVNHMETDKREAEPEVSLGVSAQGMELSEVRDLRAVERALAEKLVEVERQLQDGHPVNVHHVNQIRTLWLALERLQPDDPELVSAKYPEVTEIDDDKHSLWMTDDTSESEEAVLTQWLTNENTGLTESHDEPINYNSPLCDTTENVNLGQLSHSKFHKSHSYAFTKWTLREIVELLFRLQLKQSQATGKQHEISDKNHNSGLKKDEANKTTESNFMNEFNSINQQKLKELLTVLFKQIEANKGNPLIHNPNDYPIICMRSNSVGNIRKIAGFVEKGQIKRT